MLPPPIPHHYLISPTPFFSCIPKLPLVPLGPPNPLLPSKQLSATPRRTPSLLYQKPLRREGLGPNSPSPTASASRRRIALGPITDREQARENIQSGLAAQLPTNNTNTNISASIHAKPNLAQLHEWIMSYRRAFPSFVFYFDGLSDSVVQKLKPQIRTLGAVSIVVAALIQPYIIYATSICF